MAKGKKVKWGPWTRYYVGRGFELFGLMLTTWSMILFFGSSEMRRMLAMTGIGLGFFFVGWLLANKDPEAKR